MAPFCGQSAGVGAKRGVAAWLTMAFGLITAGCNHLFYYPDPYQRLDPSRVEVAFEELAIPSTDGLTLHGWWLKTRGTRSGVVLQFHGNAQNMSTHFLFVAWLAKEGFDVVTFDYRGYGRSPGSPDRDGMVADGKAAIDFVVQRAPDAPLFVVGQSIGGAVALPAVIDRQERIAALVLDSTFGTYRGIARDKLGGFWLTWPLQYPLSFLVTDHLRPLDFAARFKRPVVVIHGRKDRIVPFDRGQEVFDAFPGPDKEFWVIEDGDHTEAFAMEADTYREKLRRFLKQKAARPGIMAKTRFQK